MVPDTTGSGSDETDHGLSRRRALLMGSSVAAALAGCTGNEGTPTAGGGNGGNGDSEPTTEFTVDEVTTRTVEQDVELRDPVFDSIVNWSFVPEELGFNEYRQGRNTPGDNTWAYLEPEMRFNYKAGEHIPIMLKELPQVNKCDVTWNYKENYTWWDGTPVTMDDWETAYKIDTFFNNDIVELSEAPGSYEILDDYTVRETIPNPQSPVIFNSGNTNRIRYFKHDYWRDIVEKFEDATTKEEMDSVRQELSNKQVLLQEFLDEGLGNGMWKPTEWSTTEVMNEKNMEHPRAEMTNLQQWRWRIIADSQKAQQAKREDQIDIGAGLPDSLDIDYLNTIASGMGNLGGPKITISQRNKHLRRRAVRRALAYLHSTELIQQFLLEGQGIRKGVPGMVATGMPTDMEKVWLGEDFRNQLIDYGTTEKPGEAERVLQDAGYSKQGGTWTDSDGDQISGLKFYAPPFGPWQLIAQTIAEKYNNFGIQVDLQTPDAGGWSNVYYDTRDFDLIFGPTGSNTPHPAMYYDIEWEGGLGVYGSTMVDSWNSPGGCSVEINEPSVNSGAGVTLDDGTIVSPFTRLQLDPKPEFPEEVGQMDMSGSTQTFEPFLWPRKMLVAQDRETVQDLARKVAWFHNFNALHLEIFVSTQTMWGDTQDFEWPAETHPEVATKHFQINVMRGLINGRTQS